MSCRFATLGLVLMLSVLGLSAPVGAQLLPELAVRAGSQSSSLVPHDIAYTLSRGRLTLGDARFRLAPEGGKDCWRYEYQARPSGLARLFIGEVSERSDFCVIDGEVRSQRFEFTRADKDSENFTLEFDWEQRVVRSSRGELRELQPGMVDRLAMQLAVQEWVVARGGEPGPAEVGFTKVEDDRVRAYRFAVKARETLSLPSGTVATVRVERTDDKRKSTRFWLDPARNYAAIQVEQTKDGDEQLKMVAR